MKKISRGMRKILSFFDRWLITPITKSILTMSDFIKEHSKGIEKFINKKQTLIVLSLIFAFAVFLIVDRNSNTIINKSAEVLYNRPVVAEYNEEAYVIEGLPETVDITLIGRKSDLYLAKQYPTKNVSVDLRDLKPGSHKVNLRYTEGLRTIDYKIDPSTATIVVYEKVSETRELDYDLLHKDNLDKKLVIKNIDLSRNDVIIKGAEYKLKQVATVKTLIDIDNISNPKAGTITLKDIPLIAYDAKGRVVDIEIVPTKVDAQIEIASPSKEVPVKVVPKGEPVFGKSIQEMTPNLATVTLYGDQDVLDKLEYLPVEIDVSGLDKDKEYNINLTKPSGVRELSAKTIHVSVKLDDVVTREIKGVSITPTGIDTNKYTVQAADKESGSVTVVVKGSKEVVDAINSNTVKATVDLSGYDVGEHEVVVEVSGEDLKASYESKTKKVKVIISLVKK